MPPFPRVDVESQGRLSPYRADELTTFTVPNAGVASGSEESWVNITCYYSVTL